MNKEKQIDLLFDELDKNLDEIHYLTWNCLKIIKIIRREIGYDMISNDILRTKHIITKYDNMGLNLDMRTLNLRLKEAGIKNINTAVRKLLESGDIMEINNKVYLFESKNPIE